MNNLCVSKFECEIYNVKDTEEKFWALTYKDKGELSLEIILLKKNSQNKQKKNHSRAKRVACMYLVKNILECQEYRRQWHSQPYLFGVQDEAPAYPGGCQRSVRTLWV